MRTGESDGHGPDTTVHSHLRARDSEGVSHQGLGRRCVAVAELRARSSPRSSAAEPREKTSRRPGPVIAAFPRWRTSRQTFSAPWLGHRRVPTPENLAKNVLGALARSSPRSHDGEPFSGPRRRRKLLSCPGEARRGLCAPRRSRPFSTSTGGAPWPISHVAPQPLLVNIAACVTPYRPRPLAGRARVVFENTGKGGADPATSHWRIIKTRAVPNWRGPKSTAPSNNALHRTRYARR